MDVASQFQIRDTTYRSHSKLFPPFVVAITPFHMEIVSDVKLFAELTSKVYEGLDLNTNKALSGSHKKKKKIPGIRKSDTHPNPHFN